MKKISLLVLRCSLSGNWKTTFRLEDSDPLPLVVCVSFFPSAWQKGERQKETGIQRPIFIRWLFFSAVELQEPPLRLEKRKRKWPLFFLPFSEGSETNKRTKINTGEPSTKKLTTGGNKNTETDVLSSHRLLQENLLLRRWWRQPTPQQALERLRRGCVLLCPAAAAAGRLPAKPSGPGRPQQATSPLMTLSSIAEHLTDSHCQKNKEKISHHVHHHFIAALFRLRRGFPALLFFSPFFILMHEIEGKKKKQFWR